MSDPHEAPPGSPENHLARPKKILLAFFREMFSPANARLFDGIPINELLYGVDETAAPGLVITVPHLYQQRHGGHTPALVVQGGGANQTTYMMDDRISHSWSGSMRFHGAQTHSFTLHCMAQEFGQTQLLQAAVDWSLFVGKKIICQMGVDQLFSRQISEPQPINVPEDGRIIGYDGFISFAMNVPIHATLDWGGEPVESIQATVRNYIDDAFDLPYFEQTLQI